MKSALATVRRNPDIAADRGNRAVDIHRQRFGLWLFVQHVLYCTNHLDVLGLGLQFERHLKQSGGARVPRMEPVAESRRDFLGLDTTLDDLLGGAAIGRALSHQFESGIQELHAAFDVAAVVFAEAEYPAATHARNAAPVVAVLRAASVEGGVAPWSMNDTSTASISRPRAGDGTSPISSK